MAVTRLLQHKGKPLGRKGSDCSAHIPGECEDHEHFLVGSDPLKKKNAGSVLCSGQNANETSGQDRSFGVKRSGSGPSSATLTPSLKKYFLNTCVPASVMGGETKCLKNEQALLHRESREINTPNLRRDERVLAPPHPELWRGSRGDAGRSPACYWWVLVKGVPPKPSLERESRENRHWQGLSEEGPPQPMRLPQCSRRSVWAPAKPSLQGRSAKQQAVPSHGDTEAAPDTCPTATSIGVMTQNVTHFGKRDPARGTPARMAAYSYRRQRHGPPTLA